MNELVYQDKQVAYYCFKIYFHISADEVIPDMSYSLRLTAVVTAHWAITFCHFVPASLPALWPL